MWSFIKNFKKYPIILLPDFQNHCYIKRRWRDFLVTFDPVTIELRNQLSEKDIPMRFDKNKFRSIL